MKYFKITLVFTFLFILLSPNQSWASRDYSRDSLSMGPGYANDLYYSLSNGLVAEVSRDNWDIAFYTARFSAGIQINEGSGVKLFTYPLGDTSAWNSVDTAGMTVWNAMSNSPYQWEEGAFNAHQTGHPDYGWGIYNMTTHNLTGDSLFLIAFPDGQVKKLWMMGKLSAENIYHFKYANVDGSEEQEVHFDVKPFESKRFAYYSMKNNISLDREPDAEAWDLVFTKYMNLVPDSEGNMLPYVITGAANNVDIEASHFYPVADDFIAWGLSSMINEKNVIAADWKYFDMTTFSFKMVDSTCYFVKDYAGDVYKVSFVYWGGSSTGDFAMDTKVVSLLSIENIADAEDVLQIFPNPVHNMLTLSMEEVQGKASITIVDLSGRAVFQQMLSGSDLESSVTLPIDFVPGLYVVKVAVDGAVHTQKLMVQ